LTYYEFPGHREDWVCTPITSSILPNTSTDTSGVHLLGSYSKAIDDNYEAYMSAPAGSPERAAIVERIVTANAKEIAARKQEADAFFRKGKVE
jgi:hypothetical protein